MCVGGQEIFAVDPIQKKYHSQWRKGVWLGKDDNDRNFVVVDSHEIIRRKAMRKAAEVWNANFLIPIRICP